MFQAAETGACDWEEASPCCDEQETEAPAAPVVGAVSEPPLKPTRGRPRGTFGSSGVRAAVRSIMQADLALVPLGSAVGSSPSSSSTFGSVGIGGAIVGASVAPLFASWIPRRRFDDSIAGLIDQDADSMLARITPMFFK